MPARPLLRTLFEIVYVLAGLAVAGAIITLVEAANRAWFFVVVGAMVFAVTVIWMVGRPSPGRTTLLVRLAPWPLLLILLAYFRLRVWQPRALILSSQEMVSDFFLPLVVTIVSGVSIGVVLGWATRRFQLGRH